MNISFFLKPKLDVAYIYDSDSLRQGMEKMKRYGYTAIPVLSDEQKYVGTITEGDFLWGLVDSINNQDIEITSKTLEEINIKAVPFKREYPSVHINTSIEELIERAMRQNFVPVVDDRGAFIGIVTRRDIIKHFMDNTMKLEAV